MILDIHSHIIPYVDDGSRSLEDSIKLIKSSSLLGVTHIIATPHQIHHKYESGKDEIIKNFNLLKNEVLRLNIPVKLFLGEEIHYSCPNLAKRLQDGDLISINNSNVILLEFSYDHKPNMDVNEFIYNLNCDGFIVIVAHVERYNWITLDDIREIRNNGNYIQVNDKSLIGKSGFHIKHLSRKLLKLGMIDYIASDMHYFRPSCLNKALKLAKNNENINKDIFGLNE